VATSEYGDSFFSKYGEFATKNQKKNPENPFQPLHMSFFFFFFVVIVRNLVL
jgi:hypothetical protein